MRIQTIMLTLSDGREVFAVVPEFVSAADVDVRVTGVKVFEAYEDPAYRLEYSPALREKQ